MKIIDSKLVGMMWVGLLTLSLPSCTKDKTELTPNAIESTSPVPSIFLENENEEEERDRDEDEGSAQESGTPGILPGTLIISRPLHQVVNGPVNRPLDQNELSPAGVDNGTQAHSETHQVAPEILDLTPSEVAVASSTSTVVTEVSANSLSNGSLASRTFYPRAFSRILVLGRFFRFLLANDLNLREQLDPLLPAYIRSILEARDEDSVALSSSRMEDICLGTAFINLLRSHQQMLGTHEVRYLNRQFARFLEQSPHRLRVISNAPAQLRQSTSLTPSESSNLPFVRLSQSWGSHPSFLPHLGLPEAEVQASSNIQLLTDEESDSDWEAISSPEDMGTQAHSETHQFAPEILGLTPSEVAVVPSNASTIVTEASANSLSNGSLASRTFYPRAFSRILVLGRFFRFLLANDLNLREQLDPLLPAYIRSILEARDEDSVALSSRRMEDICLGTAFINLLRSHQQMLGTHEVRYLNRQFARFLEQSPHRLRLISNAPAELRQSTSLTSRESLNLPFVRLSQPWGGSSSFLPHIGLPEAEVQASSNIQLLTDEESDSDWEAISSPEDMQSLLSYSGRTGRLEFSFHPVISEDSYADLLYFNDLSYLESHIVQLSNPGSHYTEVEIARKLEELTNRRNHVSAGLTARGWEEVSVLLGATGADNRDADAPCIASYHRGMKMIVISFHGSITGSKRPDFHDGRGDWGANYDSALAPGSDLEIINMPGQVQVHRGFGRNFQSVENKIMAYLNSTLESLPEPELAKTWVIVTGHSKGAALASIAAPVIKTYLQSVERLKRVKLGAVLLSAPRAFAKDSKAWVYRVVGKRNILRINVSGDPVPNFPLEIQGYRHVGVLVLDQIQQVIERLSSSYNTEITSYFDSNAWAGYHYVSGLRAVSGRGFDPVSVLTFSELLGGFRNGCEEIERQGSSFMTSNFFDEPWSGQAS